MRTVTPILCLAAAVAAGCAGKPGQPPLVYSPADVIASGRPPLVFSVDRPGAIGIIDVTTQSRV